MELSDIPTSLGIDLVYEYEAILTNWTRPLVREVLDGYGATLEKWGEVEGERYVAPISTLPCSKKLIRQALKYQLIAELCRQESVGKDIPLEIWGGKTSAGVVSLLHETYVELARFIDDEHVPGVTELCKSMDQLLEELVKELKRAPDEKHHDFCETIKSHMDSLFKLKTKHLETLQGITRAEAVRFVQEHHVDILKCLLYNIEPVPGVNANDFKIVRSTFLSSLESKEAEIWFGVLAEIKFLDFEFKAAETMGLALVKKDTLLSKEAASAISMLKIRGMIRL